MQTEREYEVKNPGPANEDEEEQSQVQGSQKEQEAPSNIVIGTTNATSANTNGRQSWEAKPISC